MSYRGTTARIPLGAVGFAFPNDEKLVFDTALVEPTANMNIDETGLTKRGGTAHVLDAAITNTPEGRGIFQFRDRSGTNYLLFATDEGKVYYDSESNVIKTGLSLVDYFNFSVFDNQVYICDGVNIPQVWDGGGVSTSDISGIPTDWSSTGNYPFQIVPHARGANQRNWAITTDAVYASDNNDGDDFSDANVKKIPIYTAEPLVGGVDFGGTLFVFTKTKTYLIDDTDTDTANWGYKEAQWEGGVAHWRLIVKAVNNIFLMTEEGDIYSIRGVQATGDYERGTITKPAFIDRYFREEISLSNINKFHACYDRQLRAINWFIQDGGNNPNTNLKYFVDRPPQVAWIPHNNTLNASGFDASASTEVNTQTGEYKVYTQDFAGEIWKHEQAAKSDNGNAFNDAVKMKILDLQNPRTNKHFRSLRIRTTSTDTTAHTVTIWINGQKKTPISVTIESTGAKVGAAVVGTDVVGSSTVSPTKVPLGFYGEDIQVEIKNSELNKSFSHAELLLDYKLLGVKP